MSIESHDKVVAQHFVAFFVSKGITKAGIAGLLGNIDKESCVRLDNLQGSAEKRLGVNDVEYVLQVDAGKRNFIDNAGFGLCQWTSAGRKQGLHDLAIAKHKSIADEQVQFEWLWTELSTKYKSVLAVLTDKTKTVDDCARAVMLKFEVPADRTETNQLKRVENAEKFYEVYCKEEETMYVMDNNTLVAKAIDIAQNKKTLYCLGAFGAPANDKNKKRYCNEKNKDRHTKIMNASADTFLFDCVCLIKGILWNFNANTAHTYGGATYKANGVPDIGADSMIKACLNVSTDFSNIAVGECVWVEGHVGLYIGNGNVVECTPKWEDKVQITGLGNVGKTYNGKTRVWKKHGKLPWVDYKEEAKPAEPKPAEPAKPTPEATQPKVDYAKSKDSKFNREYVCTSNLNLRAGAGITKTKIVTMPIGTKVRCNGYYTEVAFVKWLLVEVTVKGVKYTGFCSKNYLE